MKRIKYACLEQTIHFELKEDATHAEALHLVAEEVKNYKQALEKRNARFKIRAEETLPDGSVLLKIGKQYNTYDCGDYLDR